MRKLGPGAGGGLQVDLAVPRPLLGPAVGIREHRAGVVALVELHAVRVELGVLQLQRLIEPFPPRDAFRAGLLELDQPVADRVVAVAVEPLPQPGVVLAGLVGPGHDLPPDGGPLGGVGVEQARAGVALDHERDLPRDVERVLDRGVRAQPARRGVAVHRVAAAEHPPDLVVGGVLLVDVPQRRAHQLDLQVGVADQHPDPAEHHLVGQVGLALGHVEAPTGDPLVPRPDRAQQTHADLAETGLRVEDPVQDARPVRDVSAQVGVEHDVRGARAGQLALERQPDLLRHLGSGAVEGQQVAGPLLERLPGAQVTEQHGDTLGVLLVRQVLGVEGDDRAPLGRVLDQQRLHVGLRDVQHRARAALEVVAHPVIAGTPRLQPGDLLPGQAGGEQGVAHLVPRGGVLAGLVLDPQVAQHLHRALVGDVRPRRVRDPREHRHRVHPHAIARQREGRGAARGAETDHDDVGVEAIHGPERHEGGWRKDGGVHQVNLFQW